MSGIARYGTYLPYFRVQRAAMGGGKGERSVANSDEDSASMAVEASREAIAGDASVDSLIFSTLSPPYAEKLNAATICAALDLPGSVRSIDVGASSRMGLGALLLGADIAANGERVLVCSGDVTVGAPSGIRESSGGDGAAAFLLGSDDESIARIIGRASATTELIDTYRTPEDRFPSQWEERFGAEIMTPIIQDAVTRALHSAGVEPTELKVVILDAANPRSVAALPQALGLKPEQLADTLALDVGRTGTAHAGLLLARALDTAAAGDRILVVSASDGVDVALFEVTSQIEQGRPARSVDHWRNSKRNDLPYNTYLKWRGVMPFEPPRRPDPERPGAPPARRSERWKMAFVGSRCNACNAVHLPPQRTCVACGSLDDLKSEPMSGVGCKVATFTIDHLAYSLNPPVVAAIVDFEGGGRCPCEVTEVDPADTQIGLELEMSFRRLYTAQGVHNYFWKARPRR